MSIRATNFVRGIRGLTPAEKAVAFVLADHDSHRGGGAFVSMTTVAKEAGLQNRETASRITKRLVAKKIFRADSVPKPEQGRPTTYLPNYAILTCDSPVKGNGPLTCDSRITPPVTPGPSEEPKPVTLDAQTCDSPVTQREKQGKYKARERLVQHAFTSELLLVTVVHDRKLANAFPWVTDRVSEYRRMSLWAEANSRGRVRNPFLFCVSWFSKIPNPTRKTTPPRNAVNSGEPIKRNPARSGVLHLQ